MSAPNMSLNSQPNTFIPREKQGLRYWEEGRRPYNRRPAVQFPLG